MKLFTQKMTKSQAKEILNWRYPPPYDLYNQEETTESLAELMDQSHRAIVDQANHLIGFYCTGQPAQVPKGHEFNVYEKAYLDIGLGMKPELTGKKLGREFLAFILNELKADNTRLSVATFNHRAFGSMKRLGLNEQIHSLMVKLNLLP